MQHLDFAYASSLIRTFFNDDSLVLTIRGRKYIPKFSFYVGRNKITVESVQTEVDAGYEGKEQIVLVEAKNSKTTNTIIRQLYYPFRQWSHYTNKKVRTVFFEKRDNVYLLWQFDFENINDYNSIKLVKSCRYEIVEQNNYQSKTTTEPFDFLDWDGQVLRVWLEDEVVETYTKEDLTEILKCSL